MLEKKAIKSELNLGMMENVVRKLLYQDSIKIGRCTVTKHPGELPDKYILISDPLGLPIDYIKCGPKGYPSIRRLTELCSMKTYAYERWRAELRKRCVPQAPFDVMYIPEKVEEAVDYIAAAYNVLCEYERLTDRDYKVIFDYVYTSLVSGHPIPPSTLEVYDPKARRIYNTVRKLLP